MKTEIKGVYLIDAATGVKRRTNRNCTSWTYGWSHVNLPRFGADVTWDHVRVRFRREGSRLPLGQSEVVDLPYGDVGRFFK